MLLSEITLSVPNMPRSDRTLGAGIQGVAFRTNRPNTVRKVYGLDDLTDPYYVFINTIQRHQDNPFFPRVYSHRVYKNKSISVSRISDYAMTGVVMMEKLHPLLDGKVPEEVARSLFSNLGIDVRDFDDISQIFRNRRDIQKIIDQTTNRKFAEALGILLSSGRRLFDLHANNWMIRLTSVGPQLVILDPVYGSDAHAVNLTDDMINQLGLGV